MDWIYWKHYYIQGLNAWLPSTVRSLVQKSKLFAPIHQSCFSRSYSIHFIIFTLIIKVCLFPPYLQCQTRQKCDIYSSSSSYSGRKLARLGRAEDWSFFISGAVTLQDSNVNERKFFKGFKCCSPSFVIREFETFKDTNAINPAPPIQTTATYEYTNLGCQT